MGAGSICRVRGAESRHCRMGSLQCGPRKLHGAQEASKGYALARLAAPQNLESGALSPHTK